MIWYDTCDDNIWYERIYATIYDILRDDMIYGISECMIWYDIDIVSDMIYYMVWYEIGYDMICDMISYDIW